MDYSLFFWSNYAADDYNTVNFYSLQVNAVVITLFCCAKALVCLIKICTYVCVCACVCGYMYLHLCVCVCVCQTHNVMAE